MNILHLHSTAGNERIEDVVRLHTSLKRYLHVHVFIYLPHSAV